MVSTSQSSLNKRPKVLDVDRLSSLPDAVICHILSFLPTNLSVSTSILAKRWRFLWAYVPTLDFSKEVRRQFSSTSFPSIINRVMLHRRAQTIDTFRLHNDHFNCSLYDVETWIISAILHGVRNLEIFIQLQLMSPPCIFNCKTLVDLTLHNCRGIPFGEASVTLPLLKSLQLCFVVYVVQEALPHLLSGCPVLEKLTIKGVQDRDLDCFEIASPTIQSLLLDIRSGFFTRMISLQYPNLAAAAGSFVRFDNLTRLELDADCCFLLRLLNSADNIEVLIIRQAYKNLRRMMEPSEKVPKCLSAHLRTIMIDEFGSSHSEFSLVKYLLKHAHVLQRMDIDSREDGNDFKEKFDALKRISSFERGSTSCELVFNEVCFVTGLGDTELFLCHCF